MKILNLVYPEKSDIKYKKISFPEGQQQLAIIDGQQLEKNYPIQIKSRLNNFLDLEIIICAIASLSELDIKNIHLYTPYFLGGRSDRKFSDGDNNYIKDVISPIINRLNFESVLITDPHSDVLEACIKRFKKIDNLDIVKFALNELYHANYSDYLLVSPDAGANKKIYKVAEQINYKDKIIICSKHRDENGKLSKCKVPMGNLWKSDKDIIIIDDICDGGGTFLNIAKEFKSNGYKGKLILIITHGIFSKGFGELSFYFDVIYCTNSYSDINDLKEVNNPEFKFKQLNIF